MVDFLQEADPYKSVDVVIAAGRGGRFEESLRKMYSQRSESKPNAEASAKENRKDDKMDEKAIEAINALTAQVTALVSAQTAQTEAQAQVEADEKAIEEAREQYASAIEAIESARADLLPSQVKHLMAEAKAGVDVAPLIEQAKTVATEALAEASNGSRVQEGRIVGGSEIKSATDLGKVFG